MRVLRSTTINCTWVSWFPAGDLTNSGGDLTNSGGDLTNSGGNLTKPGGDLTNSGGDLTNSGGDHTCGVYGAGYLRHCDSSHR